MKQPHETDLEQLGEVAPAYQHCLDALDLDASPDIAAQAHAALQRIAAAQRFQVGHPTPTSS